MRSSDRSNSLLHVAQELENLRLHGDVERGRRLVGDDQRRPAGERDGDHHALPHAARELVRIVVHALLRFGDAHRAQQLDRALARLAPRRQAVHAQRFANLIRRRASPD